MPKGQRRHFTVAEKQKLIAEVEGRDPTVSQRSILDRYGVSSSLFHFWRDQHRKGLLADSPPPTIQVPEVARPKPQSGEVAKAPRGRTPRKSEPAHAAPTQTTFALARVPSAPVEAGRSYQLELSETQQQPPPQLPPHLENRLLKNENRMLRRMLQAALERDSGD
jgi:transposase-like protein